MHEIRVAIRRLNQHPGVTIASILTLATAIGAAAATWSLVSAVLLNPLPVRDPGGLALVGSLTRLGTSGQTMQGGVTYPHFPLVRDSAVFDDVAAVWTNPLTMPVKGSMSQEPGALLFVSGNFFAVIGVNVPLGRALTSDDDRRGAAPVAVLSDRYWRSSFGADPAVVGRAVTVGNKTVTIVGVAGPGFRGLSLAQAPGMFVPLETIADVGSAATNYFADPRHGSSPTSGLAIIGRLREGQTLEQARTQLTALPSPQNHSPISWNVLDVSTAAIPAIAREGTTKFARLLGSTVALLLLIGCSTVGLLLLVRTEARKEEFATCLALGATRAQLARSIVLEGALLTAIAAGLSPLVAQWLFTAVSAFQLPGGINLGLLELSLDGRALGISVAAAMMATLLIAVIAGAFGFRADVADSLRARGGATPRIARRRTRAALLATQVAIALVLVAGTGLFARSLMAALDLNQRIDSARVIIVDGVPLAAQGYSPERAAAFFQQLRDRVAGNPAVESIATSFGSGGMGAGGKLTVDGEPRTFPNFVAFRYVDDAYFRTMRMDILRGRDLTATDTAGAPQVGLVSESFGRMIAGSGDPLGRHIVTVFGGKLDIEIVGVVDDLFTDIRDAEPLALYVPVAQQPLPAVNRSLVFRATGDADAARREVTAAMRQIDSSVTPARGLTLDERLLRQMAPQQFGMVVLGSLGTIALLLTLLGTYVLTETMAVMRTREMGIRAALGATSSSLMRIVIGETSRLVGIGLAAGLLLATLGANTIRAFLFRVQPLDWVTLGMVAALILLVSIAVSLRAALRVARVDLAAVLRAE